MPISAAVSGLDRPVALQDLRPGAPCDVLHDDVVAAVVDAGVVDLDDVGVDQLRHRQRLAAEAGDEALVVGEVLGEDLHRDGALEDPVGRLVDVRHPARAEPLRRFVAPGEGSRPPSFAFHCGAGADPARGPSPSAGHFFGFGRWFIFCFCLCFAFGSSPAAGGSAFFGFGSGFSSAFSAFLRLLRSSPASSSRRLPLLRLRLRLPSSASSSLLLRLLLRTAADHFAEPRRAFAQRLLQLRVDAARVRRPRC